MKKVSSLALMAVALLMGSTPAGAANFRWGADSDPGTMDPHSRNVTPTISFLSNIYEPLVRRSREMKLEAALATSWTNTAPDTWRFALRRNVKFHDGSPFTADDVIFTVGRTRGPGSALAGVLASVADVKKVDDFAVDVITKGPNPILPYELLGWLMMSKTWAEARNVTQATNLASQQSTYASTNANGTGPFKLRSRVADSTAVLEPNPAWWDKVEHNLTEVTFNPLANPATRVAAIVSGEVDMIYGLPVSAVPQVQARPNLRVLRSPEMRTMYFGMDMSRPELIDGNLKGQNPFKDKRVREAVRIAIDAEQIHNVVMRGFGALNYIMVGPGVEGFDPALNVKPAGDLAAAQKLMADAGFPNGFETGMDCSNDRFMNDEQICTSVVSMLAKIGIKVKLRTQPFSQYVKLINPPYETSLFYVGWGGATGDAHNYLINLMATRAQGSPRGLFNVGGYSNTKVDTLIDQIQVELDPAKRRGMIGDALKLVRDDVPYVPIMQQVIVWAAKDNIDLVQPADAYFPLRFVRVR
ncbi:MAG: ABC transporter substrate-binding protein [Alphaproteobacteria bacterium]|nr:ABC transporter substrate-binding protein [Alphaproteobacteria bacterium]